MEGNWSRVKELKMKEQVPLPTLSLELWNKPL